MVSKLFTALAAAGVAAAAGTNVAKFNAYWGQSGPADESLRERCDEGADYITLSFVNSSPENNPKTKYPGINFAAHCWASSFKVDGHNSNLLDHCNTIIRDLQYCRDKGIKMLLSIGGVWNEETSDYRVTTEENGREFANFLWGAFGPYNSSWEGPRPFDKSPTERSAVDGFDFDLELPKEHFDNKPWIAMADQFRTLSKDVFIAGAPQCPTAPKWFHMKEMIQKTQFDALFIQFYNNPGCDLIGGGFNYNDWEEIIAASDKSKNAKLFVGVPSFGEVNGYVTIDTLTRMICPIAKRPSFGGISIWDMYRGEKNMIDGQSFNQHVRDILFVCGEHTTTTTTTTMTSTTLSTTSSAKTTTTTTTSSSSTPTISTSSSSRVPISTRNSTSTVLTSTSSSINSPVVPTGSNSTSSALPTTTSSSSVKLTGTGSSATAVPTSVTAPVPSGSRSSLVHSSSAATTTPRVTSAPWSNSTTTSQEMTTSAVYITKTYVITECPPIVTDCPIGQVTTETSFVSTTVFPVTKTDEPPKPTAKPSQPTEDMTTSAVYITKTYVITECPPIVTDCPIGQVTTETSFVSTTVFPVTKTNEPPKPTAKPSQPTEDMTISTVYTTKTYVISECPPSVIDCPIGQVTTETSFVSTTVCPVTKTNDVAQPTQPPGHQPSGHQPAGKPHSGQQSSGPKPSGHQPACKPHGGQQSSGPQPSGHQPAGKPHGGQQSSGPQPTGKPHGGEQSSGPQPSGHQPAGKPHGGQQSSGPQPTGKPHGGEQSSGHQPTGKPHGGEQSSGPQPSGHQPAGKPAGGQQPSGNKPAEYPATTTTMHKALVKTLSVTPETTLTVVPVRPTGSECSDGPDCSPSGAGVPSASVVKPSTPVVTGGASSVAAGLVALVAAQIFLL
ncbi:hypothetical protein MY11210_003231 [Beauveria gryllotalpidicola]